ncbi:MAG: cytidylate kinase-like family protein [Bacteroidales bacterium]|nr:cytidylate kinase-like family protein [Bacteroidales bacterium]
MKVDLLKYMSDRLQEDLGKVKEPGPVITISREYGCPARRIAEKLTEELTRKMFVKGKDIEWKYITKEIMSESAKELELDPEKIRYVFKYEQKGLLDDIITSHSTKYYKSDRRIRNTIARVIRNISCEGNVIIVGRGGVAIAHDIPRSLHINLEAPLEWRVLRTSAKLDLSLEESEQYALDIDRKRKQFREYFEGKNTDYTRFDLSFNCMTLSIDEIVKIIIRAAEIRNLI